MSETNKTQQALEEEGHCLKKTIDELRMDHEKLKTEHKQGQNELHALKDQDALHHLTRAKLKAKANQEDDLKYEAMRHFVWTVERARELISYRLHLRWGELMMMVKDGDQSVLDNIYSNAKSFFGVDSDDWDLINRTLYDKRMKVFYEENLTPKTVDEIVKLLAYLPDDFQPHIAKLKRFAITLMDRHYFYDYT